jgi:predicted kinase
MLRSVGPFGQTAAASSDKCLGRERSNAMAQLLLLRGAMGAGKSTVAGLLRELLPETVFIEVDDIKLTIHGAPSKCDPETVFREAGVQAKNAMDAGNDAIVIEPLCTREHIRFVLNEAGIPDDMSQVPSVWLDCTLKTALQRKRRKFSDAIIKSQHQRYATRYKLVGEVVIETDELSAPDVAQQVLRHVRHHRPAC